MAKSHSEVDSAATQRTGSSIILLAVLFSIWVLWSGHFTLLLMIFGIGSSLFVVLLSKHMRIADDEGIPVDLGVRPFVFAGWLSKEIFLANIDVARRILNPKMPIQPRFIRLKSTQKSELGRVIFANSITLTPGTVSVGIEGDEILVHALSDEAAVQDKTGDLDKRVSRMEGAS